MVSEATTRWRRLVLAVALVSLGWCWASGLSWSQEVPRSGAEPKRPTVTIAGRFLAVDNVCAWPNLTLMPDGTIVATIYGDPSHLQGPGDVQCWASVDGTGLWEMRGTVATHEPETTRGNVAAGLAHNGDLVVLVSGWGYAPKYRKCRLSPWVCRSSDGGRTWSEDKSETAIVFPEGRSREDVKRMLVPFGDIVAVPGGKLAATFYDCAGWVFVLFSNDDGRTWGDATVLTREHGTETAMLRLRPDSWLAAARAGPGADGKTPSWGLGLFVSEDEGQTWIAKGELTGHNQQPGHLLRMNDGRILLTIGMRDISAVGIRVSNDEGLTWGPTEVLVNLPSWKGLVFDPPYRERDLGYPSTVQLADGTLVTAYYSIGIEQHTRYHMGVLRWSLDATQ